MKQICGQLSFHHLCCFPPFYLFLVLVYVFDLGVVYGQVPAVGGVPHAVAAGAQQGGLPLGGHGL